MTASKEITGEESTGRVWQLVQAMQPIMAKVQGIVGKVKWMAWIYLAGAVVLTGILFIPFSSVNTWMYAFAASVLVLLSIPSGILFLFYAGLQSVITLPARVLEKAGVGEASARTMLEAVKSSGAVEGKKAKVLGTLVDLRRLVMDSKDMLLEYGALLRLANPFVLGIVGLAVVAGFGVVAAALIGVVVILV